MTYQVIVTQRAKDDLRGYYLVAAENAPETAARWLDRFEASLQTLSTNPERCDLAPEDDLVDQKIRQFFFGKRGTMDKAAEADLAEQPVVRHQSNA
jgi:plasmid stabilization system protein ParE